MSQVVCKFGWKCHRPDCYFLHPSGREVDGVPLTQAAIAASSSGTPSLSTAAAHQSSATAPARSPSSKGSATPCRFDRACNRVECYFAHPNGRVIDESEPDFDTDIKEMEDLVAQQESDLPTFLAEQGALQAIDEDSWFPGCKSCACCQGWIYKCSCPAQFCTKCAAADFAASDHDDALSAAMSPSRASRHSQSAPEETKAGDAWAPWKDEWFSESRNCKRCEGFRYRVPGQRVCPDCS